MEVSCAFPTALDSPENIILAERLGYDASLDLRHAAAKHRRVDDPCPRC